MNVFLWGIQMHQNDNLLLLECISLMPFLAERHIQKETLWTFFWIIMRDVFEIAYFCLVCKLKFYFWSKSKQPLNKMSDWVSSYLTFMHAQILSHVLLFVAPWTAAHQAPLSSEIPPRVLPRYTVPCLIFMQSTCLWFSVTLDLSLVHGSSQIRIQEWVAIYLLQRIFWTQGLNPHLLPWQAASLALNHLGSNLYPQSDLDAFFFLFVLIIALHCFCII